MPHNLLLLDLAMILLAAFLGGILASRFKQSVILGYLVAGIVVGPSGLGLVREATTLQAVADIAVILLMFALGLELSLKELTGIRGIAIFGGHLQMAGSLLLGLAIGSLLGWDWKSSLVIGCCTAISSSMIVLKLLADRGELDTLHGRIMIGILIIQDLAVVVMITTFPFLARVPSFHQLLSDLPGITGSLLLKLLQATIVIFSVVVAGKWILPPVLKAVSRSAPRELFTLTSIAVAIGAAALTHSSGLTLSLGAFLAGLLLGQSDYSHQILGEVQTLRDTFVILFFTSIGMLVSPRVFLGHWTALGLLLLAIMGGKFLLSLVISLIFGYTRSTAVSAGTGLVQIGEFSFVMAQQGLALGLINHDQYQLVLASALVSTILTPLSLSMAPYLYKGLLFLHLLPNLTPLKARKYDYLPEEEMSKHVVICGYGRVGAKVVEVLKKINLPMIVIEYDVHRALQLKSEGIPCIYGDASKTPVLERAGVRRASLVVAALPDPTGTLLVVKQTRAMNPAARIVARAREYQEIEDLYMLGVSHVVLPELEGGLQMVAHTLRLCGVPVADHIQEIRNRFYRTQ